MMPTRVELQDLAQLRLEEAHSLFDAGQYDGCVYLCGYVVELALKAVICRHLAVDPYPETAAFRIHRFDTLVLFAGLFTEAATLTGSAKAKWQLLTTWDSIFRYKPRNTYSQANAQDWLSALEDQGDGVFAWLQTRW